MGEVVPEDKAMLKVFDEEKEQESPGPPQQPAVSKGTPALRGPGSVQLHEIDPATGLSSAPPCSHTHLPQANGILPQFFPLYFQCGAIYGHEEESP